MSDEQPVARVLSYADLVTGQTVSHTYRITEDVHTHFLGASGDYSPIHVDAAYARRQGFPDRVMHGTILGGFVSHFVGMVCPGRASLLLTSDLRFAQPCYLGDVIRLDAVVAQKVDLKQVVVLDLTLTNETRGVVAARGRVQVMMRVES
jgi:3-hydroxybutyryl-CoA dehydratase